MRNGNKEISITGLYINYLKNIAKVAVSALIIWVVLRNLDRGQLLAAFRQAQPVWLLWALLCFIASKIIAAGRFNDLLKTEGIVLETGTQLRLYWLGMYYNLLLPGGISGDGYKIKILLDRFGSPFKRLFAITLFDRLSGVVALGQLFLLLMLCIEPFKTFRWLFVAGLLVSLPVSKWIFDRMLDKPAAIWRKTSLQAIAVQIAQLLSAVGIVLALAQGPLWIEYTALFLLSSVVAMLPLTIGGTGARELTFLWGARYLGINPEQAVAIAFIFYVLSTAAALWGMVYSFRPVLPAE